jgi:predicted small integral membrane protein
LLPLAGVEHVTGAESRSETDEPSAPEKADPLDQQAITWCFGLEHHAGQNHVIQRPDDDSTFCRFGFFRLDDSLRDRFFLDLAALQASYVNLANHRHALGLNDSNGLYWKLEVVGESMPYVAELESESKPNKRT